VIFRTQIFPLGVIKQIHGWILYDNLIFNIKFVTSLIDNITFLQEQGVTLIASYGRPPVSTDSVPAVYRGLKKIEN
jgi:hypothetical protein